MSKMWKERAFSNRVFSNSLLFEKIIYFAIRDGGGEVNYSTVQSCRLVNSTWLLSVTQSLRKSREPLLIYNSGRRTLNDLDLLLTKTGDGIPPLKMTFIQPYLKEMDYSYLLPALSRFQSGLVSLELRLSDMDCPETPNDLQQVSLPLLRKLSVKLGVLKKGGETRTNSSATSLIQLILSGCSELKQFTLQDEGGNYSGNYLPLEFEKMQLPLTLTELNLHLQLKSKHLRGLFQGDVPKLTKLAITFGMKAFEDGLIFGILEKVCDTLKHLTLRRGNKINLLTDLDQRPPMTVQLPRMKCLKTLVMRASNIKCTTIEDPAEVEAQLPMLQTMHFGNQTLESLRTGMEAVRVGCVKSVYVQMGSTRVFGSTRRMGNYTLETSKLIFDAFPNIVRLHLTLDYYQCTDGLEGLSFLFQHFTQLQELSLNLGVTGCLSEMGWNAVLLGISAPPEAGSSAIPEEKHGNKMVLTRDALKSITNMTGLQKLHLQLTFSEFYGKVPVSCDTAFQLAFVHMLRLQNIHLQGHFTASPQIIKKWRESGRTFHSSPTLRRIGR